MYSKLKLNTTLHRSGVFTFEFDHSQYINVVFLLLTLNKHLSVGCARQVIILWNTKSDILKVIIKVAIEVARPISFSDYHYRIEINYVQMTILWTYYRTVGSFFMVVCRGLIKKVDHHGWPTTKNWKNKHWLKRRKTVPKNETRTKI